MPRANEQKIKLLVLYDILQRETDEEHPLSTNEIIERLSARGIEVSRKILPGDIALLNKYGFEILSYKKKSHYYYVAYRPFDIAELKVLIDAVQAATFISESKTEGLVNRLASMAGEKQAEKLKQNFICYDTVKKDSKYIFYYIDEIERAIEQGNKISFCYCYLTYKAERKYRKDGQRYIVNPLALVYSRENYYVVCYDNNHKGCANYRIDRILGYKRVGDTYVIEPEQAETVRMIYSWYLQGDGMRTIMGKLIENKRKCASGIVRWDTTKVSRVLHNATYMGYIGYNKSYRNNFLDQKIIHNKEEDYVLVKGDFEPIIPEDVWYACRDLRMDRSTTVPALVKSKQKRIGVTPSTDVWTNKLRYACGSKFKRYKWRQDKDGQRHFGYSCYSRFNNGSAEKRQELGLDTEGYCDMPSVNETRRHGGGAVRQYY